MVSGRWYYHCNLYYIGCPKKGVLLYKKQGDWTVIILRKDTNKVLVQGLKLVCAFAKDLRNKTIRDEEFIIADALIGCHCKYLYNLPVGIFG